MFCVRWGGARDTGTIDMDKFRYLYPLFVLVIVKHIGADYRYRYLIFRRENIAMRKSRE
jgi:hypothetical protein